MSRKVSFFQELGMVLVSINYRLTSPDNSVQHPDHVEDVAAAMAWVRQHAREFGGDPAKVALLGHSAGAHLVALLVTNARFLEAEGLATADVRCVGSYDTEYSVADIVARNPSYEAVFTSDPEVWRDASPSEHVRPGLPAFQLACRGTAARVSQCRNFAEALRAAGNQVDVIDASTLTHQEVNEVLGDPNDQVMTPRVRAHLEACFSNPSGSSE